jgi:hypothetical protein
MWPFFTRYVLSKDCTAFIFGFTQSKCALCFNASHYDEELWFSKTSITTCTKKVYLLLDLNLHSHHYANLTSDIIFTLPLCYKYYVRVNVIIQLSLPGNIVIFSPIYILYLLFAIVFSVTFSMTYSSPLIRWSGHEPKHLPPSVQITNACSDTQILLNHFMLCNCPRQPF